MAWFSKKGPNERTRQIVREIVEEYGVSLDNIRYNIYQGRPYTLSDDEICIIGAAPPGDDPFAFAAKISSGSLESRRIPWDLAMQDKKLSNLQKYAQAPLYERICDIAKRQPTNFSSTIAHSTVETATKPSAFSDGDRSAIVKILEQWRDGELTDEELTSGLGVTLVFGLRELTDQWINGDISDDYLLTRLFLASDILLGLRDDLDK